MSKLVLLGGSSPHTRSLFEALRESGALPVREICLVGRSAEVVERRGRQCQELADRFGLDVSVTWETDVAHAARGATYVVNVIRVGGAAAEADDRAVVLPASGIVGHAASYPEAIRHLPATVAAAAAVERVAPSAVFINFTNPVSILCEAVAAHTELTVFGVCHHAFGMRHDFARLLGVSAHRVRVGYFGINHLGWVTEVLLDEESVLDALMNRLQASRSKTYDHQLIRDFGAIPIKHAASLYRKGEALYVRQYGLRSSAADVVARFGGAPSRRAVRWWTARKLASSANSSVPWYRACIVPFLETLSSGITREHVLTWRHDHQQLEIPGLTAETTAVVEDGQAKPVAIGRPLPMAAQEWLRQIRASERLLIQAVDERSPSLLMESLAIHPSVASVSSAKQFAARYETQW